MCNEEKRGEKLRYMYRNQAVRALVAKREELPWSSFRHYATGELGVVEIESQWTAFRRENQMPEHLRYIEQSGRESRVPTLREKEASTLVEE